MVKIQDKDGNELIQISDYAGVQILHGEDFTFGLSTPSNETEATYFFNALFRKLEAHSKGEDFFVEAPFSDKFYDHLIDINFLQTLKDNFYPYELGLVVSEDGHFYPELNYHVVKSDKIKKEILLELGNTNAFFRVTGEEYSYLIERANEYLSANNLDILEIDLHSEDFEGCFSEILFNEKWEISNMAGLSTIDDFLLFVPAAESTENMKIITSLLMKLDIVANEIGEEFRYLK